MAKKILVTGADGFIGSHLTETLVRAGYEVRAFVLYNSFNSWGWLDFVAKEIRDEIEIVMGDVRDSGGVKKAVVGCEVILHLAALIGIPFSYHSPETYVDTNIKGTLNILQAGRDLSVKRIIHTSTSEVYGTALSVPMREDHPLQGQSPYAATKIAADQLALSFYRSFGVPVTILRPFNTYGPRQSARAVIPTIITQIAKKKRKIHLGSIASTRDFNFVKDTVSGFMAAIKAKSVEGEVLNLGSSYEISIADLTHLIAEIMNSKVTISIQKNRLRPSKSEVERLWADNSKAKALLDWSPQYSGRKGLATGLVETIKWFCNKGNLCMYKKNGYIV